MKGDVVVESCVQLSWKCLKKMAQMYHVTNPALSRYYLSRSVKMKKKAMMNMPGNQVIPEKSTHCFHCFTMFEPGNHSIRVKPKKSFSHISKLLAKNKKNPKQLGSYQKKMVDKFLHMKNKLVISCFTCKKSLKIGCQSNEERTQQKQQLDHAPPRIEEKVKTKKQRQRAKRKMKQKKKFCKFLFDNEEEAEAAANKKNNASTEDAVSSSVPADELPPVIKPTETPNRQSLHHTLIKCANLPQTKYSSKTVGNASRTSKQSRNTVVSKKNTSVINVVKSNLSSKKKKGRDIHQQLKKVLDADKNKNSGNSLQDFLSSL